MNRRQFLSGIAAASGMGRAAAQAGSKIRSIDIVHHTHLDVGYTALPAVVRDDQTRYLDAAIDCCRADPAFRWTVETLVELDDWWRFAPAVRRAELESLVRAGRIDVMGLPFNQTAFLNAMQWRQMMSWIPPARWKALDIRAAMQNDVNGFPRAGAAALLDRGIHHLLMGINADSGGPPFRRPDAFWWKLPDGRRLFVWLGEHYGSVMNYLAPAREGFRYRTDEASLRAAQAKLAEHLAAIEAEGYAFDRLILTHTHPQHYDNGYPFPSLAALVAAWNRLELAPALRLTTAGDAVFRMERAIGGQIATLRGRMDGLVGQWGCLRSARGGRQPRGQAHGGGGGIAGLRTDAGPRAGDAVGHPARPVPLRRAHLGRRIPASPRRTACAHWRQYVEKSDLAYKPMGMAEALLERRVRAKLDPLPEGVYAINPTSAEISGWATVSGVDAKAGSLVDTQSGAATGIIREEGRARCWLEKLPAQSVRRLRPDPAPAAEASSELFVLKLDSSNWPLSAGWPGMKRPLFDGPIGHFLCVEVVPPANRRTIAQLHAKFDAGLRAQSLRQTEAAYGEAGRIETPHTVRFTQEIRHARLGASTRALELWKREPRARLTVTLDRLSSLAPEVLFLSFGLPDGAPAAGLLERRRPLYSLPRSASRLMQGLLRHRWLGGLWYLRRTLAMGHARRPAGGTRRSACGRAQPAGAGRAGTGFSR